MNWFYLLVSEGGTELDTLGPFSDGPTRDEAAREERRKRDDRDGIFWLDVTDKGEAFAGTYRYGVAQRD